MADSPQQLVRIAVPELDEILGRPFPVLDHGFVRVVDYLGGDPAIVQAARVSYGSGTKHVTEDRGLIRYLMRHRHTTPFEMCEVKLHVRVPMDCWRQWIRHRTANVNEYSTRYSLAINAAQTTPPEGWRLQAESNRQGSDGYLEARSGAEFTAAESELHASARKVYADRVDAGIAREQARKDLPLSTYTEAYWKIDLHNLLHFLELRMEPHAQQEIRAYASVIGRDIVARWCPLTWEAFEDYRLDALALTRLDVEVLRSLAAGDTEDACRTAKAFGWLRSRDDGSLMPNRERTEFEAKADRIGLKAPWTEEVS